MWHFYRVRMLTIKWACQTIETDIIILIFHCIIVHFAPVNVVRQSKFFLSRIPLVIAVFFSEADIISWQFSSEIHSINTCILFVRAITLHFHKFECSLKKNYFKRDEMKEMEKPQINCADWFSTLAFVICVSSFSENDFLFSHSLYLETVASLTRNRSCWKCKKKMALLFFAVPWVLVRSCSSLTLSDAECFSFMFIINTFHFNLFVFPSNSEFGYSLPIVSV